jgi:undecaprenyl-diphosphatase
MERRSPTAAFPLPSSGVPDPTSVTTEPQVRRDARRRLVLDVAVTFVVVLAVALVIGLILRQFFLPTGATSFDRHITDWVFAHWRTPRGLTVATRVSWAGGPILVIPTAVAVTTGLALARRWRLVQFFVTTVVGGVLVSELASVISDPRRPPGELGLRHPFASSFPSGHAAAATATYIGLALVVMALTRSRTVRVIVWVLAVALIVSVCAARVYLAVHWTTDVLTGCVIDALWAFGMRRAFRLRPPT